MQRIYFIKRRKAARKERPFVIKNNPILSQIGFEQFAARALTQAANGFFLDLTYAFAGQSEFVADFFQRHFLTPDAEKHLDDVAFAFGEGSQRTVYFFGERLVYQRAVGNGGVVIDQDVEQTVVFAFDKRRIDRNVPTRYFHRVGDFVDGNVQLFGQFFGRGAAFVLLFEF